MRDFNTRARATVRTMLQRRISLVVSAFLFPVAARHRAALHQQAAHPDEGFSFTSYMKGELFLNTLEDTIGALGVTGATLAGAA